MNTRFTINLRLACTLALAALFAVLQGCATTSGVESAEIRSPIDPYERFNRSIFTFNENVDRTVLKPVAVAYRDVTPEPVRRSVTNFFDNVTDAWSLVNNALQLKPMETGNQLFRVSVNTLWGVGGIFDVASDMGISKHTEDFGQTLGYWGVKSGPYVVLPLLGPSTMRDSVALLVDMQGDVVNGLCDVPVRNSLTGLRLVDARSNFLSAGSVLEQAALDKYTFFREVFLQRRRALIGRGVEKEERFDLPEAESSDAPASSSASSPAASPVVPPAPVK